ncbi:DNA gyrase subunit A, partial [Rickettsiales endosymbiont of Peranema trichophorum]|uniref:DNA gyrase subunit A n=1 Tax=Rickettsiales endosymbiont of Peranema trichophorum TaxID=2486577 RepID=UPI0010235EE8
YLALVRMAQDFSLRIPLIDGQGNFGSVDGDPPAQMRYTEIRLAEIANVMLGDIEHATVDFQENYDGSEKEPKVLPARFPNILVNGATGIAVGMATNIPTHNLGEVIDGCCAYIKDSSISVERLTEIIPGPDFPTGGVILGTSKSKVALATGRGSIQVRGKVDFEEIGGREAIIVSELPYQVNKSELIKRIEELVKEKVIEGIHELRDETNKLGMRIVIELKKDAVANVVLMQLYKNTELQTSISYNLLALNKGIPLIMNVKDVIVAFIEFREEVITRRITYLLNKARDRAHLLIGLSIAVSNIDQIIQMIKSSPDSATAKQRLMNESWPVSPITALLELVHDERNQVIDGRCYLTEEQAKAILEMRLQRLTGLEKSKIEEELNALSVEIAEYLGLLSSKEKLFSLMHQELLEIKDKFATPRQTTFHFDDNDVDIEELIQREEMVVTLTLGGYVKRVALDTYRAQKRGGKGRSGVSMHKEDITSDVLVCNTHDTLLFFSDIGKVYKVKVYQLPLGTPQTKGRALINIFPLAQDEKINNIMVFPEDKSTWERLNIVFATAKGNVRRNSLEDFVNIQSNGKIAMKLEDDDKLIGITVCDDAAHLLLSTRMGQSIRFPASVLRVFKSRSSDGVRGIQLGKVGDAVISMSVLKSSEIEIEKREEFLKIDDTVRISIAKEENSEQHHDLIAEKLKDYGLQNLTVSEVLELAKGEQFILSITENGYGKRTSSYEYRVTDRGGKGILNIDTSERNGMVIATFPVLEEDDIILITNAGTLIRTNTSDIRITRRNTMGVKIFSVKDDEKVISVTRIAEES